MAMILLMAARVMIGSTVAAVQMICMAVMATTLFLAMAIAGAIARTLSI
jgi:hypothetical protein